MTTSSSLRAKKKKKQSCSVSLFFLASVAYSLLATATTYRYGWYPSRELFWDGNKLHISSKVVELTSLKEEDNKIYTQAAAHSLDEIQVARHTLQETQISTVKEESKPYSTAAEGGPWSWKIPFILSVVKDSRPTSSWFHIAWTIKYEIDIQHNQILFRGMNHTRDMNLPDKLQRKTIPKYWINRNFPLPDRLRQIQQGRDQLSILKLLLDSDTGYCSRSSDRPYDPEKDERTFIFAEDDWELCDGSMAELDAIVNWALNNTHRWTAIRLARGNGAMMLQCRDLPELIEFLQTRVGIPGVDWSVDLFFQKYKPTKGLKLMPSVGNTTEPFSRMYRVAQASMFRHNDDAESHIWKEKGGLLTRRAKKRQAGCDNMISVDTWYTGFKFKECGPKHGNFLFSPCKDDWRAPLPRRENGIQIQ